MWRNRLSSLLSFFRGRYQRLSKNQKPVAFVVSLIVVCCGCLFAYTIAIGAMQGAGILPTYTPQAPEGRAGPTIEIEDLPPTSTDEPTAAATAVPTNTSVPTDTAVPTNTATPTKSPTSTPIPTQIPATTVIPAPATSIPTLPPAQPTTAPVPTDPPAPTTAPEPTQPPPASSSDVKITYVNFNGDINPAEPDEYAIITNTGSGTINLSGWRLNAGNPGQDFNFPGIDLAAQQSCRVYTNQVHPESCGGASFGSGSAIWLNSGDCGYLFDNTGAEVSRYCY